MTMIARASDGMPLSASVQEDDELRKVNTEYQNQAKMLCKKLGSSANQRSTIESGKYYFHYLIEGGVIFLTLCERNFSRKQAFAFLEDISHEFLQYYGSKVATVARPYAFIEFDTYTQKAKKNYMDARVRRNLVQLNSELHDVQRIMVENLDDVLQRGATLTELDSKASHLNILSQKYKKDATTLNKRSLYMKIAAGATFVTIFLLYFYVF